MDLPNVNLHKICRTCLLESSHMVSLSTKMDGNNRTLFDVLLFVLNNNVTPGEKFPNQICGDCEMLLYRIDEFKRRCDQSESILKEIVDASQSGPSHGVKLETQTKNEKEPFLNFLELNPANILDSIKGDAVEIEFDCVKAESKINVRDGIKEEFTDYSEDSNFADNTENVSDSNNLYNCPCGEGFSTLNECEAHLDNNKCSKALQNNILMLPAKCDQCGLVFKSDEIKEHLKTHIKPNSKCYKCVFCKKEFSKRSNLQSHLEKKVCSNTKKKLAKVAKKVLKRKVSETPDDGALKMIPVKCEQCDIVFKNMKTFKTHIQTHKSVPEFFQCSQCMRKFKKKSSLITHMKNHEEKDNVKYVCEICKREFKYQAHLDNHNQNEHSKKSIEMYPMDANNSDKKRHCKLCNKSFSMQSTLTDHMRTHTGEKPFLCSICGKGFTQKTNLGQHMRRHLGLKPFKCTECERGFVSKGELDAHLRKHSGAHPFVCDECGNGFTTSSSLRKHKRVHTGERPYACDLCPMKFSVSGTLKSHRRTHTGEKPYQCSYCEKAFVQRQDLISHIRCHTGERPFACAQCGQAFRKPSALKAHARTHRGPGVPGPGVLGPP